MAANKILDKLPALAEAAQAELAQAKTVVSLDKLQTKYLGRNGQLTKLLRTLKDLPVEQKAAAGAAANQLKLKLTQDLEAKQKSLTHEQTSKQLGSQFMDITIPGQRPDQVGKLHPITAELLKIEQIFQRLGFEVAIPNLIDDDYNTFTALNIPEGHPARDMWDTIRVSDNLVLIPHTSAMQNRILSGGQTPIRAIVPGNCFRNEATDARHEHTFYQVEGIYADRGIKLSDMLGTLVEFLKEYFEQEVPIKIQPTYFPFVEPGVEILMQCPVCKGKRPLDCPGCSGSGWMEVIPCGPIHPFVLKAAGLDPAVYSGFAWGFGLERMIMVKHQIDDVRLFHSGRLDFINQF